MKVIETVYGNVKYRSRTEARWAVFLSRIGIEFDYELEGFDLDGLWYLPDFWLRGQRLWAEVKAESPDSEEIEKAKRLALFTDRPVVFLIFSSQRFQAIQWSGGPLYLPGNPDREKYIALWHVCWRCKTPSILPHAQCAGFICWKCGLTGTIEDVELWANSDRDIANDDAIEEAFLRATRARFEHGETPGGNYARETNMHGLPRLRLATRRNEEW